MTTEQAAFEKASEGLKKNPTEGQVETDVIIPLLRFLGYTNIQAKVTVTTQAGRRVHTGTQADIVAFEEAKESLPTLVADAKKPAEGVSRADLPQVQSYAISPTIQPRAKFVMLSNGYASQVYPVDDDDPVFAAELASLFLRVGELRGILSGKVSASTQLTQIDIGDFFKRSHDQMYSQDSIKPTQALIIMTKLILVKLREEEGRNLTALGDILKNREAYFDKTRPVSEKAEIDKRIRDHVNNLLQDISSDIIPQEDRTIGSLISLPVLFDIVEGLTRQVVGPVKADIRGKAFEIYLAKTLQGRELGQYFTPRNIVDFMVEVLEPTYKDLMIDPACGTGGFMRQAYLKIRDNLELEKRVLLDYAEKKEFLHKNQVFGIDKDPLAVQLCIINMFMWGDSHSHIYRGDGLIDDPGRPGVEEGRFSVVLTNPPFGSSSSVKVKADRIPANYDMGYKWEFSQANRIYEKTGVKQDQDAGILFLERCVKLAAPSTGRIGIILPSGVFNNKTMEYVREWIHRQVKVKLLVSLPLHTFKLAGANNLTSILICQRKIAPDAVLSNYGVAIAKNIGFDENGKTTDKNGHQITNDLPEIARLFRERIGWDRT